MNTLTPDNQSSHADTLISMFAEKIVRRRDLMRRAADSENWKGAQMQCQIAGTLYSECLAIFSTAIPGFSRQSFDAACDLLPKGEPETNKGVLR